MTDPAAGAPGPRGVTPSPVKRQPGRRVRQIYRVSAVRRPSTATPATRDESPPATAPVADEEIVHALLSGRTDFVARVRRHVGEQVSTGVVMAVELADVRPASSVLLELIYTVDVPGNANAVHVVASFTGAVIVAVGEQLESALGAPVAVAAAPYSAAAGPATAAAAAAPSSSWDKVAPVLAAIGTGIGVIGFVTFVGGLIVWARLNGAGFPAAPALSVYPKQDLLVIGAQTLVPQLLVALLVVAVLSGIYVWLRNKYDRVGETEATLLAGQATRIGAVGMFVFILAALLLTVVWFVGSLDWTGRGVALLGAVGLAALGAVIGSVTRRFLYLAVTSFVMVGVFMSFVAYWRARDDKQVRGAALIRDHKRAVAGIFLTEGAGRVYLARISLDGDGKIVDNKSRIVGIDKSQVSDVAIAGAKPMREAIADAHGLARELCALQPKLPAKERTEDCLTGASKTPPEPSPSPPKITRYSAVSEPLDRDGGVLLVLPPLREDATGVVSFVTRDKVWTTGARGDRRRVQIALSTKPFRAQAGRPIRVRVHLSRRARRAIAEAGGALPAQLRVVAVGSKGLAARENHGCVLLHTARAGNAASC
jgi:hypothetical protein